MMRLSALMLPLATTFLLNGCGDGAPSHAEAHAAVHESVDQGDLPGTSGTMNCEPVFLEVEVESVEVLAIGDALGEEAPYRWPVRVSARGRCSPFFSVLPDDDGMIAFEFEDVQYLVQLDSEGRWTAREDQLGAMR